METEKQETSQPEGAETLADLPVTERQAEQTKAGAGNGGVWRSTNFLTTSPTPIQ